MKTLFFIFFIQFTFSVFSESVYVAPREFDNTPVKIEKSNGSSYVQNKPDTPHQLTIKLATKVKKYLHKYDANTVCNICQEKPKKFTKYNTYMMIIDDSGNILAHSGNSNFMNKNFLKTRDFAGNLFIEDYLNRIKTKKVDNYSKYYFSDNNQLELIQWIHLEKLENNIMLATICTNEF
jgi:Single Cache domain 2